MGRRRRKAALAAVAALALCALLAARVWWVNAALPQIPLEYYEEGEWVALEGAFQNNASENTAGYALMVEGAEVMTCDEYLERYGDGTQEPGAYGDARCVADVALRIRRDGADGTQSAAAAVGGSDGAEDAEGDGEDAATDEADAGGLNIFQTVLVPERGNEYLICDVVGDEALWPKVQTGTGLGTSVSIRPGTEYVVHVPYVFNVGSECYERDIDDREFTLLVSRMPQRKMIRVRAGS